MWHLHASEPPHAVQATARSAWQRRPRGPPVCAQPEQEALQGGQLHCLGALLAGHLPEVAQRLRSPGRRAPATRPRIKALCGRAGGMAQPGRQVARGAHAAAVPARARLKLMCEDWPHPAAASKPWGPASAALYSTARRGAGTPGCARAMQAAHWPGCSSSRSVVAACRSCSGLQTPSAAHTYRSGRLSPSRMLGCCRLGMHPVLVQPELC